MRHQVVSNRGDEVSPNTRADETNKLIVELTVWREYYNGTAQRGGNPRPTGVDWTDVPATSGMTHDTMKTETEPDDNGIVERVRTHLQCTTIDIEAGYWDQCR